MTRSKKKRVSLTDSTLKPDNSKVEFHAEKPDKKFVFKDDYNKDALILNKKGMASVKIIKPQRKPFKGMVKDAGAGVKRYFRATVIGDNEKGYSLVTKSGTIGDSIKTKTKDFKNFEKACEEAEKMIDDREERGYKVI